MNPVQRSFVSIEQVKDTYLSNGRIKEKNSSTEEQGHSFQDILLQINEKKECTEGVVFSKHANNRLASRNIHLDERQIERLNRGVQQAKEKRINESLVVMDGIAFIVNIKNNTVVTAMDQETNENNVFTNIDGAVIV